MSAIKLHKLVPHACELLVHTWRVKSFTHLLTYTSRKQSMIE